MNGNNVQTDSFDSSNPSFSTNGRYDPTKATTNGTVGSIAGVLNIGNSDINGDVYLGPTASDSLNNNGSVTGTTHYDWTVDFPDVVLPVSVTTFLPAIASPFPIPVNGISYNYYFNAAPGIQYVSITGNGNIYVAPGARVVAYCPTSISPSYITVGATNGLSGNLQVYIAGSSFTLSGQATVDGGVAGNLGFWGLPTCTDIQFTGNAAITGTIYAPEANIRLGGGGSDTYDIVGSIIGGNVTVNGHFNFHYDEALSHNGPVSGYAANYWKEL
jgi:hypothetical protein